jgi:NADPH-dependent glutamate synthase beta subunit-like oxidoreductase
VVNEQACGPCGICRGDCPALVAHDLAGDEGTLRGALAGAAEPGAGAGPCRRACPLGQDISGYLACLARGDQAGALEVILRDNPLPAVLGHVCHHPCQQACLQQGVASPPRIRGLKRFAAAAPRPAAARPGSAGRGRVAIVGSGPAGLAAAWELARGGAKPVIHEAQPVAGGMLAWAIPEFRLPRQALEQDLAYVLDHGVELLLGRRVEFDGLAALRAEYDAVILACGAPEATPTGLPGEELPGVHLGLDYLRAATQGQAPELAGPVLVVGGGNVALDAARLALRGGRRVSLVYRRDRAAMPAYAEEVAAGLDEGLELLTLRRPLALEAGPSRRVAALAVAATELAGPGEDGRPAFRDVPGGEERLEAGSVILAVGQRTQAGRWARALGLEKLAAGPAGRLAPGLYAAGDLVTGPATVVEAMAQGLACARAIAEELEP